MQIEIIVIGAFALLTIGRVAWEILHRPERVTTKAEEVEAWDAIR